MARRGVWIFVALAVGCVREPELEADAASLDAGPELDAGAVDGAVPGDVAVHCGTLECTAPRACIVMRTSDAGPECVPPEDVPVEGDVRYHDMAVLIRCDGDDDCISPQRCLGKRGHSRVFECEVPERECDLLAEPTCATSDECPECMPNCRRPNESVYAPLACGP